jgi:hypothetical protein
MGEFLYLDELPDVDLDVDLDVEQTGWSKDRANSE